MKKLFWCGVLCALGMGLLIACIMASSQIVASINPTQTYPWRLADILWDEGTRPFVLVAIALTVLGIALGSWAVYTRELQRALSSLRKAFLPEQRPPKE